MMNVNGDLIGYTFTDGDGRTLTVVSQSAWSEQYMDCEDDSGYKTVRLAKQLRRHQATVRLTAIRTDSRS